MAFQSDALAFLGVCERAAFVPDGHTNLRKWNVLGLKNIVLSNVYPMTLYGLVFGFALRRDGFGSGTSLRLVSKSGKEVGTIGLHLADQDSPEPPPDSTEYTTIMAPQQGWSVAFVPIRDTTLVIQAPDLYYLEVQDESASVTVGQLVFALIDPPPLTPERIAAIKSDPLAIKAVRTEFGCRNCDTKLHVYAGLDRSESHEKEGFAWYADIPTEFRCGCGGTILDLSIVRRNLHGVLGQHEFRADPRLNLTRMYETSAISGISTRFRQLLDGKPREEDVQQFIALNPLLLHQFAAQRLFQKPPLLASYVADFGVLTANRLLILIELEKPATRLLNKNGGVAAPLQHAFDQATSWLQLADDHRLAVLESLKLSQQQVGDVRAVVIAGRDNGYDARALRAAKATDRSRISFLTYDDLLYALIALAKSTSTL